MIYSSDGMKKRIEQIKKGSNKSQNCQRIWIKQNIFNGQENTGTIIKKSECRYLLRRTNFYIVLVDYILIMVKSRANGKNQDQIFVRIKNNQQINSEAQVYQFGEYVNDERNVSQKYIYSTSEIGGWQKFQQNFTRIPLSQFDYLL